jgi:hypothetical protein
MTGLVSAEQVETIRENVAWQRRQDRGQGARVAWRLLRLRDGYRTLLKDAEWEIERLEAALTESREREKGLRDHLRVMTEWARQPSPIPVEPFAGDLRQAEKLIGGCICPSHASNRGECPVHDDKGRVREAVQ